ncbi:MAG: S1 RNA-binding domain-containing protein [Chloroflexi bacterium]|nr:S1 RNA-binding domain-containing protein [Chloroflexota bacterium]
MEEQGTISMLDEGGNQAQEYEHSMAELLAEDSSSLSPRRGDVLEGTIVGISPTEILIDIGAKCEGVVGERDLEQLDADYRKSLKVGAKAFVYVIRPEDGDGNVLLSLSRARVESDWQEAAKLYESGDVFEETVAGYNRGGLIVNIGRARGFVPASQIYSIRVPREGTDEDREQLLEQIVGKKIQVKVIELDRRRNRLILSERAAIREWRQDQKDRLLDELQEGAVRHGVVSSLCDFGAFVDLGGADGLIHLSELSWRRVGHAKQVLEIGQEVDVLILSIDREKRRIALSLKRLQKEPWAAVEDQYQVGQLVPCTITKLTNFGAFARLDDAIEGLIHISELSEDHINHPSEVVSEGQQITLRIIRIDSSRQRVGLSLRRVSEDQYSDDFDWTTEQLPAEDGSIDPDLT